MVARLSFKRLNNKTAEKEIGRVRNQQDHADNNGTFTAWMVTSFIYQSNYITSDKYKLINPLYLFILWVNNTRISMCLWRKFNYMYQYTFLTYINKTGNQAVSYKFTSNPGDLGGFILSVTLSTSSQYMYILKPLWSSSLF